MIYRGSVTGIASSALVLQNNDFLLRGALTESLKPEVPLLFSHDHSLEIGIAWPKQRNSLNIEVIGEFFLNDELPKHIHVLRLLQGSMIRALSVGFQLDDFDNLPHGERVIRRGTLLEISLCEVGGNPNATIRTISFWPVGLTECQQFWKQRRHQ
jgi:HK97 family phage prohead protease